MEFSKIYANGCSFTCAGGINFKFVRDKYKEILNIDLDEDYIKYAYPNIIGNELNIEVINQATSGGSINRLIRKTYQYVYDNKISIDNSLFILELPPMWRDEIYCNKLDRFMNVTWGTINMASNDMTDVANGYDYSDMQKVYENLKSYFYNFVNTDIEYKKSMNNLLGLIHFLKNNNITVLLIDNTLFEKFLRINNIHHNFNFVNFDNFEMQRWFIENKWTINDELGSNVDGHAGIEGNQKIAKKILNYLYKN
jgi:hypothetical protein